MMIMHLRKINLNKDLRHIKRFFSFENSVRVRFAPSPTGLLHLGGLRTALYNYAFAKSNVGKFILRIEDTDQDRKVEGAVEKLLEDLEWTGLFPDEGPQIGGDFGPYIQSQRQELYRKEADKLIKNGSAYYCFCSKRRLDMLRRNALSNRQVPKYDNHCRSLNQEEINTKLSSGSNYCIRFKLETSEAFIDLVYGRILHEVKDVEGDPVIIKSDGLPTYHLANVVDDHHMKISHVIRGLEWLQSTNKHLMIYRALQYNPPEFAHLPLLLNPDGTKLSKRHGDFTVSSFRRNGIQPRTLINFVTKAGSGFNTNSDEKLFSLEELSRRFNITSVNSNSCKLPMDRLHEFNRAELLRQLNNGEESEKLVREVKDLLVTSLSDRIKNSNLELDENHIERILKWSIPRISTIHDLIGKNFLFLWIKPNVDDLKHQDICLLESLNGLFKELKFQKEIIASSLKKFSKDNNIPFKTLMGSLRLILSGLKEGPGVAEMMEILGKETSISRIDYAITILKDEELIRNS